MLVEQILDDAAQILSDPDNWAQGQFVKKDGSGRESYCSMEALWVATAGLQAATQRGLESEYFEAVRLLVESISELDPDYGKDFPPPHKSDYSTFVMVWNDLRRRKHVEVMQAFEKAVALAGERGL